MKALRDKNQRPIMIGDVLKVFHFTGARRKRHYMYKQVLGVVHLGLKKPEPYLKISHLNLDDSQFYHELLDGRTLEDYEIVQGTDMDFRERKRASPQSIEEDGLDDGRKESV